LINTKVSYVLAKGIVERIGVDDAILRYYYNNKEEYREVTPVKDHNEAIKKILDNLIHPERGVIEDFEEIEAIGHRVVHGGEKFAESVLIDNEVIEQINYCSRFAPLHNPHNLKGIYVCKKLLPDKPQVAVFDTAFHQQMPPYAYIYAIPYIFYQELGIRRYGFHGTSHYYVAKKSAQIIGKDWKELKIITCHLGNGASITAVAKGVSVDTSMGFTPLEGLVMGTRCGDIDPAVVLYIMEQKALSIQDTDNLLNKLAGLKGLSQISNDMREIIKGIGEGNKLAELAFEVYCYRIKKYIGAYAASMGGVDILVFTAGIGENCWEVREKCCSGLDFMGITIDAELNKKNSTIISKGKVKVMVVPTNEELVIAQETERIINASFKK